LNDCKVQLWLRDEQIIEICLRSSLLRMKTLLELIGACFKLKH
jgi:hypothetical protein